MGSPLGPALANIFLCHHETTWLKNGPKSFKLVSYKRYVNDIFVLLERPEPILRFVNYMNKRHKNIRFSFKTDKINLFLFSMLRFVEKTINLQQKRYDQWCIH